jgi:precorrin-6A/cobalt-precorrin-6A reductase
MRLLLLGGTGEARLLAAELAGDSRVEATVSLAGAVARPQAYALATRTGGFGGAGGLAAYLGEEGIAAVVDATHPYAARISANAVEACAATGIALLRLERPAWTQEPGDRWTVVADVPAAVDALPPGARPFLALGRKEIGAFARRGDLHCLMRMIDPPEEGERLPPGTLVLARPGGSVEEERALLEAHGLTHVVAKNSGGGWSRAKILAARALGLPVVLIDRPALAPAETVSDVDAVRRWLESRL